jgi:predicted NUDIX family phosphoesterase
MDAAETVLVVDKAAIELPDEPCTFIADDVLGGLYDGSIPATFAPRAEVETDETRLQIIPYLVVTSDFNVFGYCRAKGGERRLEGQWSVGIGGHINEVDRVMRIDAPDMLDALCTIESAIFREADEETRGLVTLMDCPSLAKHDGDNPRRSPYDWRAVSNIEQPYVPVCIYTPNNAVGRVHLGIVYTLAVSNETLYGITAKDPTLRASRVFKAPLTQVEFDRMEMWSKLSLAMAGFTA